ncbi:MAG TPA: PDZ domain-containing protein, partial [Salegentibacter sp.]|nr:PDZ domain-containing protein [Salegentibacter sp.]
RKIVEDILEYGDVQKGILGIRGLSITPEAVEEFGLNTAQGVYVAEVTAGSGAEKAGIKEGDVIRQIDNITINKFSDLTGYINSKRPDDEVEVTVVRKGKKRNVEVRLTKNEIYRIDSIGLEVTNATQEELEAYNTPNGVKISRTLMSNLPSEELVGTIITAINNETVKDIGDVERIMNNRKTSESIVVSFIDKNGEKQRVVWR